MNTLPEIRAILLGEIEPILSDDSVIVKNHDLIYRLIHSARGTLVKEDFKNKTGLDPYYQTHTYAVAATKSSIYIDGVEYPYNEPVIEIPIPALHGGIGPYDIQYFGGLDWNSSFHRMTLPALRNKRHMQYTGNKIAYAILDNKIILSVPNAANNPLLQNNIRGAQKYWMLRGIYDNPTDAYHYDETEQSIKPFITETRGSYTAMDYPFPEHKMEKLQILIIPKLRDLIGSPAEKENDAVDSRL